MRAGVVASGAMGAIGLSWTELQAWAALTGATLTAWEAETLYEMSAAYAVMLDKAKSPTCPAPWVPSIEQQREKVSNQLARILDGLVR